MRTIFDPIYPTAPDEAPAAAAAPVEAKPDVPPAGNTTMDAAGLASLRRGDIDTAINPMTARVMVVLFMLGICGVPAVQTLWEVKNRKVPQAFDVLRPPVRAVKLLARGEVRESARALKYWLSKQHLTAYEDRLTRESRVKEIVRPRLQMALSKYGQFGDTNSIIATDMFKPNGWLFYQLGLDYVTGHPFLDAEFIKRREKALTENDHEDVNGDPREAIIAFHQDCQRNGVHLIYVPVPTKPMLQPMELAPRLSQPRPLKVPQNASYARFIADLKAAGVDVFDPTPEKVTRGEELYLRGDTHWTPEFMEHVAQKLAEHVKSKVQLPPAGGYDVRVEEAEAAHVGDIAVTLQLPDRQRVFPKQTITIRRVVDSKTGEPRPRPRDADVLLLGDSFTNIYSADWMKWGDGAGFGEQLSRFLARDVDVIAENGEATEMVLRKLAERGEPFKGKRVIIWEVTMHELSSPANWPVVPFE